MTPTAEQLEVTQADRDAAVEAEISRIKALFQHHEGDHEDVITYAKHVISLRQATEARAQGLVDAAQTFTDRLKSIHEHPAYKSVWMVNQAHYGPYDPQYTDELEALETALATWRRT